MATRARKKTTTIPTSLKDLEKQVTKLRKDIEKTAGRVRREATRYIPKQGRRQLNDLIDRVGDLGGTVTKTVKNVRADVEGNFEELRDTVEDLRGTFDKRVKTLRKDVTDNAQTALETIETETRKQVEKLLKVLGVPAKSDIDGIKRRVGALERKLDELVEGALRKRNRDESQAA
jgi:predicted  nucleic acid-binding Zn-ribbon protein